MNDILDTPNHTNYEIDSELNLETNFNIAMKMSECEYDYSALIEYLKSDKLVEKQIAVLKLSEIKSEPDAQILVSNLVGQDGKIREAVAFKVNEFIQNPQFVELFKSEIIFETLLKGIMDINGNVCRQIVDLVGSVNEFDDYLCANLPNRISIILDEIQKIDEESKQYVVSKRNFQLYWCLEALSGLIGRINIESVRDIIFKAGEFQDYTIREKAAKILARVDYSEFDEIKNKLSNDDNYYVRRCFNVS